MQYQSFPNPISGSFLGDGSGLFNISGDSITNVTASYIETLTTNTTRITASAYIVQSTDFRLGVVYTKTGSCTISLPLISDLGERDIRIKDEGGNSDLNNITVLASGSDTIDGSSELILDRNYIAISLYNNGVSEWFIE